MSAQVHCDAEFSYDTRKGYFTQTAHESSSQYVSMSLGRGSAIITVDWRARAYFDEVTRVRLSDGSCRLGSVSDF